MNRRRKIMFGIIGIIAAVAIIGTIAIKYHLSAKEKKAIQLAQEYLFQKYEQEMKFKSVRYSWIDPAIYHVTFSPVNIPEMSFEVYVQNNLTILPEGGIKEFGRYYSSPDNYYFAYFNWKMENRFQDDVKKIWSEDVSFAVLAMNQGLYGFSVPADLNDKLSLDEMEGLIEKYYFYVDTNRTFNEDIKLGEAKRILDFIQVVRESGYKPSCLVIYYNILKDSKDTKGRIYISFDNWSDVLTVDQVIEQINIELEE